MKRRVLWLLLASLASAQGLPSERKVVVISLDGLRPEFYLDSRWPAPCLQRLRQQGAWARTMTSVFPSITYANHTSLVTGVSPLRHGIDCNIDFDWDRGPRLGWNWEAQRIQAPPLWELARRRKLTTSAFSWPVSLGARIDSLVPEVFSVPGANQGSTEDLIRKTSTAGLIDEIQADCGRPFPLSYADWDGWLADAVGYVWRTRKPRLTLVHMLNLDWTQHRFGPDSPETRAALAQLDRDLERLLEQFDGPQTVIMVVGDHGFLEVNRVLAPNRLFWERGWIEVEGGRIRSWKVLARSNGGSAAIYVKDPSLVGQVQSLLDRYAKGRWQVLTREQLDQRSTFARASLALSAMPGCALTSAWDAPLEKPTDRPLGQHGHLPEQLPTGWLIVGAGIPADLELGQRSLLEVAPTVGRLLQLDCRSMEWPGLELLPQR
jgi:predicted AlkP superfamily pyrophosphatase or phosphodiesterase